MKSNTLGNKSIKENMGIAAVAAQSKQHGHMQTKEEMMGKPTSLSIYEEDGSGDNGNFWFALEDDHGDRLDSATLSATNSTATGEIETSSNYDFFVVVGLLSLLLLLNFSGISLADDHGNWLDSATPVVLNTTTIGNIETSGDYDFFIVDVSSSGTLTVYTSGDTNTYGYLRESTSSTMYEDDNSGDGTNFRFNLKDASEGMYYIAVSHSNASGTGDYQLVVEFTSASGADVDDHGHGEDGATSVPINSTTHGNLETSGDYDWFVVDIPSSGFLTIYTSGDTDTYGYWRKSGTTTVYQDDDSGYQSNFKFDIEDASEGPYFIAVSHVSANGTGDYTLHVEFYGSDGGSGCSPLAQVTKQVSVHSDGTQGNHMSIRPSISGDGRYVAFMSSASNFTENDTNDIWDIFVHDRYNDSTERVSVHSDGTQGNYTSQSPSISEDGRFVAFGSSATNLVDGDTNDTSDVFLHDRVTESTTRVSLGSSGAQGNGRSVAPSISGDGRYIAFMSSASNLVTNDTNGKEDIFMYDRQTGATTLVSVHSDGTRANDYSAGLSISLDGRYVAFWSPATNLVDYDTNDSTDVFVHDRVSGSTTRVSVLSNGLQANDSSGCSYGHGISGDGRYVTFGSYATNLVYGDNNGTRDIFVHDRQTKWTTRVNLSSLGMEANGYSSASSISADGRYVAFVSSAFNLVDEDTNSTWDVFVHDRHTKSTERVSVHSDCTQGNDGSYNPHGNSISSNGRYIAFDSEASNLVDGDTNGFEDIFVHERSAPDDLIVIGIETTPASPSPGELVTVEVTVKNQGTMDTGNFHVDWYADYPTSPSPGQAGDCYEDIWLAGGATYTMACDFEYDSVGEYNMWAQIDTDEEIEESDENNNILGPKVIHVGKRPLPPEGLNITMHASNDTQVAMTDLSETYSEDGLEDEISKSDLSNVKRVARVYNISASLKLLYR